MFVEGIGKKAPQPTVVEMSPNEMFVLKRASEDRATFRNYRGKKDAWSNGLSGDLVIDGLGRIPRDVRPIFAGFMGEYACVREINRKFGNGTCAIDTRLNARGDWGVDILLYRLSMQVKTSQGNGGNLIKRIDERGRVIDVPAKAVIFCLWGESSRVRILGWAWTSDILEMPLEQSHRGSWRNLVVPDEELSPIGCLMEELEMRKGLL